MPFFNPGQNTVVVSIVHCAQPQTQFAYPGNKLRVGFVIRDSSSAIASGRGPSLPTPETYDTNTHTPPALIMRNVSPPPIFQR